MKKVLLLFLLQFQVTSVMPLASLESEVIHQCSVCGVTLSHSQVQVILEQTPADQAPLYVCDACKRNQKKSAHALRAGRRAARRATEYFYIEGNKALGALQAAAKKSKYAVSLVGTQSRKPGVNLFPPGFTFSFALHGRNYLIEEVVTTQSILYFVPQQEEKQAVVFAYNPLKDKAVLVKREGAVQALVHDLKSAEDQEAQWDQLLQEHEH